ncbi:uncharacterized protein LOC144559847 isoform X1 [Carex rostrata]
MKRQLPSTSSVEEPQRNVRRAVSLEQPNVNFPPGVQSVAPNLHADHQSTTSVYGASISSSSDTPQGLQALAGSTSPHACVQCEGLISSEVPPPASDPLVPSTSTNLRSNIPASEERNNVSLPSTSPVDEPQRHVRSRNPFARSTARHFRVLTQQERQRDVSLEQPHGIQPGIQSVAPNLHAGHQSPTSVPGESISGSSDAAHNLHPFDGSVAPRVFAQHESLISAPDEMGISLSSEVPPPTFDPLVPSTAPQPWSRFGLIPPSQVWISGIHYSRVILRPVAHPVGSLSLDGIAVSHLSEQPQNRTSQGQTSNQSQYQNPQIIPAVQHRNMRMDINRMSYEELLALEERIGKVNTGVKTSELSKFVKKKICCGEQDEADQCVICQEQYADTDVKGQLKCGHEYHFSCIGKWMEEQAVCAICRQRAAHFEQ